MHVIESIGPVLGIVAFVGLAILAFLLFQQARDIRRMREWAGRAPERAAEAADAVQAAAEASREADSETGAAAAPEPPRGRLRAGWERASFAVRDRYHAVDRRLPLDARYLLAVIAVAVIAVGVVTSGFGLVGGGEGHHKHSSGAGGKPTVAVLNGTSVQGLALKVEKDVVKKAGYDPGPVGNTPSSVGTTSVMYASGAKGDAKSLAKAVAPQLGDTPTQAMTSDVQAIAGKAKVALVLGLDDAGFGGG
jgi:hypothetical protein